MKKDKKDTTPKKEETSGKMVTIADLSEEFNVEGKDIRVLLRANGYKAPAADTPKGEFGPRNKYQWPEGSKELKEIRALIQKNLDGDGEGDEGGKE